MLFRSGKGERLIPLEALRADECVDMEPADPLTADRIYERRWALTLLEQTMTALREEFTSAGKQREFESLKTFLTAERGEIPYSEIAAKLGINESAARVSVHRLRKRFREVFRQQIAHTVARPEDVEEEVRYLLTALDHG